MIYYAGIGSRETPESILNLMKQMGAHLAKIGVVLRSGGAEGADQAFEEGCDSVNGLKEIYLPWKNFQNSHSKLIVGPPGTKAYEIAEEYHPYWANLSDGVKKLQARNSHQVLGEDLATLSNFVICYTAKGKGKGGTGQAIRIAKAHNIPIFDCGLYEEDLELLKNEYRAFLKTLI